MGWTWAETVGAYAEAGRWFVELVDLVDDRWAAPGLGEWDVRSLVGHASRSFVTVETYLGQPAAEVEVETALDYYRAARSIAAGPGVAERGVAAGLALGDHPVAEVADMADRVIGHVTILTGDELLTTIVGGMRLRDYLPTRVFELAVHGCDLCRALDLPLDVPELPARQALALVGGLAASDGVAGELLLALTGRTGLRDGFSVM
jgi:hypothetical protein